MTISYLADLLIVIFGCIFVLSFVSLLILAFKTKESPFAEERIDQKLDDIRNTVCMLSDLILEETPEGQRFLEKHPDCFENSEACKRSDDITQQKTKVNT